MKAQSADPNWANQTENELFRLSYTMFLEGESNVQDQTNLLDCIALAHVDHVYNI